MRDNETIIRELYTLAEGDGMDMQRFVAAFSDDGYMTDIPTATTLRGRAIGDYIGRLTNAFPDIHRELFKVYSMGDDVVVELAIRGTHQGELSLPSGTLAPTGRTIDVPCCDVFHLDNGRVASFHCYNAASVMVEQLGVAAA